MVGVVHYKYTQCHLVLSLKMVTIINLILCIFYHSFLKVYLFILRERTQVGGGEERERERREKRIPSRLHTVSAEPEAGLNPTNHQIMT